MIGQIPHKERIKRSDYQDNQYFRDEERFMKYQSQQEKLEKEWPEDDSFSVY